MAVDIFMHFTNGIKGESKDDKHKDEIDVLSWSWGMSQTGSGHVGGGSGAGKVSVQDLSFTKYVDKSSPDLMLRCCNGEHIDEAKLTIRKAGGDPLEYGIITMQKVLISSIQTGASNGDDRVLETVGLNFVKVKFDYAEQAEKGGAAAKPKFGWDIEANKKL